MEGNAYVELVYSQIPTDLSAASSTIGIPDNYSNAIIDYCLFRAFTKDAEFAGNGARAGVHYQMFAVSVQGKAQIDAFIKPDISTPFIGLGLSRTIKPILFLLATSIQYFIVPM